jgi:type IX secretion system PorP/SprF family membrane protein
MTRVILILLLCFNNLVSITAQDIHFSQYHNFPMMINPAYTGNFNGAARVAAIYRNQWFTIANPNGGFGTYQTVGLAADMNLMKKELAPNKFSVGMTIFNDMAGNGNLYNREILASISYIMATDRYGKSAISLGMQGGLVMKGINVNNLLFESQVQDFGFNPSIPSGELPLMNNSNFMYPDFNIGAMWQQEASDYVGYYFGVSVYHIAEPKETFYRNSSNYIPRRYNFNAGVDFNINDEVVISPSFLYMKQANAQEVNIGATFKYNFSDDIQGYALARFRGWSDAFIIGAGVQHKSWRGTLSYDFTTSDLAKANNGQGGFELSLVYIHKPDDNRRRRRDQFCPSY